MWEEDFFLKKFLGFTTEAQQGGRRWMLDAFHYVVVADGFRQFEFA